MDLSLISHQQTVEFKERTSKNEDPMLQKDLATPTVKREQAYINNADFLKLTPVNINCLTSPLRLSTKLDDNECNEGFEARNDLNSQSTIIKANNGMYAENFSLISKQLEKLLENLNVIYNKIGYSNTEITNREKKIFATLSCSITGYFEQADKEMNTLLQDNEAEQQIINKILEVIDDSSGTQTIPDLYMRNSVLVPKSKKIPSSPKKEVSLLNKNKILLSAKKYVFDAYVPKLILYLQNCVELKLLVRQVYDNDTEYNLGKDDIELISLLPSLETLSEVNEIVNSMKNDYTSLSNYMKTDKLSIIFDKGFQDLSANKNSQVQHITEQVKELYRIRLVDLKSLSINITNLLSELNVDSKEIDLGIRNCIKAYSAASSNTTDHSLPVHAKYKEKLQKVFDDYQIIYTQRQKRKDASLQKCKQLWAKLKVPQNDIDVFISNNNGLSLTSMKNVDSELQRLETMKKKLIKTLITDSWNKIEEIWNKLQYAENDKKSFVSKFEYLQSNSSSLENDEYLLEFCENELQQLEGKLALYEPVLKLYKDFKSLQNDHIFLEKSSKDSSRLLSRNSHKILLQEEKTRKRIIRHFPHVIQDLKRRLQEMEQQFGKPFSVEGEDLSHIVAGQELELINKYPRIRMNSITKRKVTPKKTVFDIKPEIPGSSYKIDKKPIINNSTAKSSIDFSKLHKTPMKTEEDFGISGFSTLSKSINHKNTFPESSVNKQNLSHKPLTKLMPPTIIKKMAPLNILDSATFDQNHSPNENNTQLLKTRNGYIRPTRLFPVSSNTLNHKVSQIPTFIKNFSSQSNQTNSFNNKENNAEIAISNDQWNSPQSEPNNSIYKISVSPEGKLQLNYTNNQEDNSINDTSLMDENDDQAFLTWKKEQLLKFDSTLC